MSMPSSFWLKVGRRDGGGDGEVVIDCTSEWVTAVESTQED